ncbi:type I restriction-modification system subunit M [Geotoga petraea]|uniref:site-specific DNA-methyltransferase (adenine-specific) n=1 Tax=Geotoga petraea TaxID=28234 RepID=A0A4Z0VUF6_9BACT|nr:class I SAM-dependent DNA methyltransferase [Geotoga petraea]TGG87506.1 SAM-dependent DNA methyltransferase [Geotoga petraea]
MSSVKLGWEDKLWSMADKLRGNIEASEYKHVILGLVFLKYVSDAFEERYNQLVEEGNGFEEERDAYTEVGVFFVPPKARWDFIKKNAKKEENGQIIDDAMVAIERENAGLKGVLPKDYGRPALDKFKLGELVDMLSFKMGDEESRVKDILGRVYEFFLGKFGKIEGTFYTPPSIVKLLVEMLQPYKGRVYDPCCGSGGMFVQSQKFVEEHSGRRDDIHIYGQEYTATTWKMCKMNLAIRGIDGNIGERDADTFHNDVHKRLKADYIMANPPFNMKDWGANRLQEDVRWKYGMPPANNANYAWIQHMISKLSPNGVAGFVLANGSMSTNTSNEGEIRKNLIEDDLVDCIVTLPGQLFYTTQIPVCLWFIAKNKRDRRFRDRSGEILFIDARKLGYMEDRTHKILDDEKDIKKIADTYHSWRNAEEGEYEDVKGFCKSATLDEVREHEYILTPGRYVGIEEVEDDGEPFDEKMTKLTEELAELFAKSRHLEDEIKKNLGGIGYEF